TALRELHGDADAVLDLEGDADGRTRIGCGGCRGEEQRSQTADGNERLLDPTHTDSPLASPGEGDGPFEKAAASAAGAAWNLPNRRKPTQAGRSCKAIF